MRVGPTWTPKQFRFHKYTKSDMTKRMPWFLSLGRCGRALCSDLEGTQTLQFSPDEWPKIEAPPVAWHQTDVDLDSISQDAANGLSHHIDNVAASQIVSRRSGNLRHTHTHTPCTFTFEFLKNCTNVAVILPPDAPTLRLIEQDCPIGSQQPSRLDQDRWIFLKSVKKIETSSRSV